MIGFIPNLILASKAFADSTQEAKQQVIESNQLNVRSVATRSDEKIVWDIYYRSLASTDQQQRLKVQVTNTVGQVVTPIQKEGWTTDESSWFVSAFHDSDEGVLSFETSGSVTSIQLAIQADSQSSESGEAVITENSLPDISAKKYTIAAPEEVVQATAASSEATRQSSSEQQVAQSTTEASIETAKSNVNQEKESTSESTATSSEAKTEDSLETQVARTPVANFSANSVLDSIQSLSTTTSYSNVSPEYTNDGTGIYPKSYWSPTGNTTVRNHQGKLYGATGWDGVTTWKGDASNKTNSYIEYGGTGENADFAIRKYAKETSNPGLYDVYLNVRGNEIKDIKPIDIVLVIDMSGSMNTQSGGSTMTRADAVRQGVRSFLQHIIDAGISKYVNVGFVGYSSQGGDSEGNYVNLIQEGIASVNNQAHVNTINTLLNRTFLGGTFTQRGIRTAADMLSNYSSQNQKMMILMTDGVPTFSYKVTAAVTKNGLPYGTSFSNTLDEPAFTSQLWTTSRRSRTPNPYTINGLSIKDTWAATLGEADIIMNQKNIQLHTLGIQLAKDVGYTNNSANTYLSVEEVRKRMSLMASDGHYLDANTADDVKKYLENQAANVVSAFNTVNQGSISDPIGAQFNANGSTVDVKSVGSTAIATLPNATLANNQLSVSNVNLGKGQEIQIHYQVRIKTEDKNFIPEKWYQINGRTTLTPNGDNPTNKVDFGIPSAKAPGIELNLSKMWVEQDSDSSIRPQLIDFTVTRDKVNSSSWTKGYIRLTEDDNKIDNTSWGKQNISKISESIGTVENLSLPKYNNQGEEINYSIDELYVPGYVSTKEVTGNSTTWTNTKILRKIVAEKYNKNGENSLSGAEFTLKKFDDNWNGSGVGIDNVLTGNDESSFSKLPTGFYSITETTTPTGFKSDSTEYKFQIDGEGKLLDATAKEITAQAKPTTDGFYLNSDNTIVFVKYNELNPFTFSITKVDEQTKKELSGAEFSLAQEDAPETILATLTTNAEGTGTFVDASNNSYKMRAGSYIVTETKAPTDYVLLPQEFNVKIAKDGKVTATYGDKDLDIGTSLSENTIQLTVANTKKGILPATGGKGKRAYVLGATAVATLAILVGGVYVYRNRKGGL